MSKQMKSDIKSLCVRLVGSIAKGVKINNIIVLSILFPACLAFVWTIIRSKLRAMLFSNVFFIKPLLKVDGNEETVVTITCAIISLFALFPLCRILQLSFPETFEPFADSTENDD